MIGPGFAVAVAERDGCLIAVIGLGLFMLGLAIGVWCA